MKFMLSILLLSGAISLSRGCSCVRAHLQYSYCNADFVVLAMPFIEYTPDEPYPDYRTYALLIFSVYKDTSGGLKPNNINNAVTAFHSATCGVNLNKFVLYVLGGSFDRNGKIQLSVCQINIPYENLTPCELAGIRGYSSYSLTPEYDCTCKVKHCFENNCWADEDECVDNFDSDEITHGFCKKCNDQCQWDSCVLSNAFRN